MRLCVILLFPLTLLTAPVQAQNVGSLQFGIGESIGVSQGPRATVTSALVPTDRPDVVTLAVKVTLPEKVNTYSQSPDFPKPTKITLTDADGWTPLDDQFESSPPPKEAYDINFNRVVGKFFDEVTFTRRYQAPTGTDLSKASLTGRIELLLCDEDNCLPRTEPFTARLNSEFRLPAGATAPRDEPYEASGPARLELGYTLVPTRMSRGEPAKDPVRMQFELFPKGARPGETVTLAVTMEVAENWSTYGLEKAAETQLERPTTIRFETVNLEPAGAMTSVPEPKQHQTVLAGEVTVSNVHEGRVTWLQEFTVIDDAPYGVDGTVTYQICEKEKACLAPNRVAFSLGAGQKEEHLAAALPITESFVLSTKELAEQAAAAGQLAAEAQLFTVDTGGMVDSLGGALLLAFLAGLIMNVMPCVLPVLAIKILSLVQQAGESRARILSLNLVYTLGVMSVFFAVAIISWGVGQSLGAVFQNLTFMTVMACVIFLMGLSLFGIFELPVPGIIPSAGDHQEGYLGAFNTGIIATILGIPCIAPFVVGFFTWTLTQPGPVVFLVFGTMGIGMASPYLMTGLFPALVNWLPKPGMWMVRFKQFTGFVMMGTVVWLLYVIGGIEQSALIPTLILLLALGLCVWMMAELTSPTEPAFKRWRVYVLSVAVSAPVFLFGLWMGQKHDEKMPWQPFSEATLVELRQQGKPMLIDFTADWCVICKLNESVALNTQETADFVRKHGITPLMADFTNENDEIRKWLNQFGQDSVPLTLIIPPGPDSQIIALRGQYTKGILLEKLHQAFAGTSGETATAQSTVTTVQ